MAISTTEGGGSVARDNGGDQRHAQRIEGRRGDLESGASGVLLAVPKLQEALFEEAIGIGIRRGGVDADGIGGGLADANGLSVEALLKSGPGVVDTQVTQPVGLPKPQRVSAAPSSGALVWTELFDWEDSRACIRPFHPFRRGVAGLGVFMPPFYPNSPFPVNPKLDHPEARANRDLWSESVIHSRGNDCDSLPRVSPTDDDRQSRMSTFTRPCQIRHDDTPTPS